MHDNTDTPRTDAYWQDRQDEISEIIARHRLKSADTPRTDDQFVSINKMVPTDCCNSAPEKRLADKIRYWDCSKCGSTIWIENPITDHNEQHLEMVSDTPRTDAAKVDKGGMTFVWLEFAQQLEQELAASEAEVERLAAELHRAAALMAETGREETARRILERAFGTE